jgi:hypothetical protein
MPYGSQVIKPGQQMPQWGTDELRSQSARLNQIAQKLMMQGAESGGSESTPISGDEIPDEFYDEDFGAQETSISASGMEDVDPLAMAEAEDLTEMNPEDIDFGMDDPMLKEQDQLNQQIASRLSDMEGGMPEQEIQRVQDQFDPLMQTNNQYAGTGQAPQMDPMIQQRLIEEQRRNMGAPQQGMPYGQPQGRFQIPNNYQQGRRF